MSLKLKLRLGLICRYLSNSRQREMMVDSTAKLEAFNTSTREALW